MNVIEPNALRCKAHDVFLVDLEPVQNHDGSVRCDVACPVCCELEIVSVVRQTFRRKERA